MNSGVPGSLHLQFKWPRWVSDNSMARILHVWGMVALSPNCKANTIIEPQIVLCVMLIFYKKLRRTLRRITEVKIYLPRSAISPDSSVKQVGYNVFKWTGLYGSMTMLTRYISVKVMSILCVKSAFDICKHQFEVDMQVPWRKKIVTWHPWKPFSKTFHSVHG